MYPNPKAYNAEDILKNVPVAIPMAASFVVRSKICSTSGEGIVTHSKKSYFRKNSRLTECLYKVRFKLKYLDQCRNPEYNPEQGQVVHGDRFKKPVLYFFMYR